MDGTRIMEFNRSPILAFADDIAIIRDYQEKFITTTEETIGLPRKPN